MLVTSLRTVQHYYHLQIPFIISAFLLPLHRSLLSRHRHQSTGEPTASMIITSTPRSSRVSLPHSDANPSPRCAHSHRTAQLIHTHLIRPPMLTFSHSTSRSSAHSPTISVLHTTSETDYSSPLHSPPPVPYVIPSIRFPTPSFYLMRLPH